MKYVSNTEFLCKLFTKSFRDKNGIDPQDIKGLVKHLQDTIEAIHRENILLVDINEMNFLVDQRFTKVYCIDTDSYQTKSYPATALMESVRDRQVKNKHFTTNSDWFSFSIVAFQLYMGCHPYKGRHPDYSPKDWMRMMDDNVSIFDKDVKLPPATQDWSVIPPGHLKWFQKIFKGERLPPPQPDALVITTPKPVTQIISSNAQFEVKLLYTFLNIIVSRCINGVIYTLTSNGLYANDRLFYSFTPSIKAQYDVVAVQGDQPAIVEYSRTSRKLKLFGARGLIAEFQTEGFFVSDSCVYSIVNDLFVKITLTNLGAKIIAAQEIFGSVFTARTLFDGFVWQNMLGTCRISAPALGAGSVHVKELDGARLVAGRFEKNFLVAFAEKAGKYYLHLIKFNGASYEINSEESTLEDVNFTVKNNGVCVLYLNNKLLAFHSLATIKEFAAPLNDETLISLGNDVLAVGNKNIYKISSK